MQGIRRGSIFIVIVLILSISFQGNTYSQVQENHLSEFSTAVEDGWTEIIIADKGESVGASAMEAGDIDGDSLNEVVVGLRTQYGQQLLYYELVDESWTETVLAEDFMIVHTLTIGDLDGDDANEILVGGAGLDFANSELCYFELISGEWVIQNITNPDQLVMSIAIGDLDNDGVNEVAAGYMRQAEGYELRYYEFNGDSWTEFNIDDDLGECDGIEIVDLDHDGENEVVFLGSSLTHEALCYYDYNGGIWNKTIIRCPTGWGMDTGDVDNDGDIEIAWGNYFEPDNEVRIYDNIDGFWTEINVSDMPDSAARTGVYHVAIGDVDNDNLNELAVGGERVLYQVRYFEFIDDTWVEHRISSTPYPAQVVVIADIDNDDSNEILVGLSSYTETSDEIRYYEQIEEPTTTTESATSQTNTTTDTGQLDPMILAIGIAVPVIVILAIVLLKFKKKS